MATEPGGLFGGQSFIFWGDEKDGMTYEQLKQRRAIAAALAARQRGFPKNVGEGLTYLGEAIGDRLGEMRLAALERENKKFNAGQLNVPLPGMQTPTTSAPPVVQPQEPPPPSPVSEAPAPGGMAGGGGVFPDVTMPDWASGPSAGGVTEAAVEPVSPPEQRAAIDPNVLADSDYPGSSSGSSWVDAGADVAATDPRDQIAQSIMAQTTTGASPMLNVQDDPNAQGMPVPLPVPTEPITGPSVVDPTTTALPSSNVALNDPQSLMFGGTQMAGELPQQAEVQPSQLQSSITPETMKMLPPQPSATQAPAAPVAPAPPTPPGGPTGAWRPVRLPPAVEARIANMRDPQTGQPLSDNEKNYFRAMVYGESKGNPNVVSSTGARGVLQFIPGTAKRYGLSNPADIDSSLEAGQRFTADNRAGLAKFLGREPTYRELAVAHQQGLGGAKALLSGQLPSERNLRVNNLDPRSGASGVLARIGNYYGTPDIPYGAGSSSAVASAPPGAGEAMPAASAPGREQIAMALAERDAASDIIANDVLGNLTARPRGAGPQLAALNGATAGLPAGVASDAQPSPMGALPGVEQSIEARRNAIAESVQGPQPAPIAPSPTAQAPMQPGIRPDTIPGVFPPPPVPQQQIAPAPGRAAPNAQIQPAPIQLPSDVPPTSSERKPYPDIPAEPKSPPPVAMPPEQRDILIRMQNPRNSPATQKSLENAFNIWEQERQRQQGIVNKNYESQVTQRNKMIEERRAYELNEPVARAELRLKELQAEEVYWKNRGMPDQLAKTQAEIAKLKQDVATSKYDLLERQNRGSPEERRAVLEQITKSREGAAKAPSLIEATTGIRRVVDNAIVGAGANQRLDVARALSLLGHKASGNAAADTQRLRAEFAPITAAILRSTSGTSQLSEGELKFARDMSGGEITMERDAIKKMLDLHEKKAFYDIANHNEMVDRVYRDNPHLRGVFRIEPPIPVEARRLLMERPDTREMFERKYGRGSASIVGGQ